MERGPTIHKLKTVKVIENEAMANDLLISGWILLDAKISAHGCVCLLGHPEAVELPWKRQVRPMRGCEAQ